ncbi:hypothetical protein [Labrenzia sp. OB1]|uniref:hypothetical protein n=1 Tax=Labrenzia sp. OB1 TaxID=1561204 RepID=UPI000A445E6A|nr:hypothetical protein [Labrenzia sp. OB1]
MNLHTCIRIAAADRQFAHSKNITRKTRLLKKPYKISPATDFDFADNTCVQRNKIIKPMAKQWSGVKMWQARF